MSEKYPFRPEDEKARSETEKQFHEDRKRVPEALHGDSALKKYESGEKEAKDTSQDEAAKTAELQKKLEEALGAEWDRKSKMQQLEKGLTREEYIKRNLGK